jgi:hypothetical protein
MTTVTELGPRLGIAPTCAALGLPRATYYRRRRAAEDPTIASDSTALQERYAALEAARSEVDRLYTRWAELDAKTKEA